MNLKNGILHLNVSTDNEMLQELLPKLQKKIEKIEEVIIEGDSMIASSALFSIVASLKKSKESIKISYFDKSTDFTSLGNVSFIQQG